METRRLIMAMTLSLAVIYGWWFIRLQIWGPPRVPQPQERVSANQPASQPTAAAESQPSPRPAETVPAETRAEASRRDRAEPSLAASASPGAKWWIRGATEVRNDPHRDFLGRDDPAGAYHLKVFLDNRGAAVSRIVLVAKDKKGRYRYREAVDRDEPYALLNPLVLPDGREVRSWQAESVRIVGPELSIPLRSVPWNLEIQREAEPDVARFWVDLMRGDQAVARIVKTFRLAPGSYDLVMSLQIKGLTKEPIRLVAEQLGPVGISREDPRWDYRKIYAVLNSGGQPRAVRWQHKDLLKKGPVSLGKDVAEQDPLWWLALANKYFAAVTAPAKAVGAAGLIADSQAFAFTQDRNNGGDVAMRMTSPVLEVRQGSTVELLYELYIGPKDKKIFSADPRYVERQYNILRSAEYAWCTFSWLGELMIRLLGWFHDWLPLHNYGVAIFCLVILVRTLLHPLTKHQQVTMAKMQQKQAEVQPKLEAIKQKYANDRQKLQEETLKIYREAGINPAGQLAGCLPMLIQMPIWVALYSALNYDINLRHAPFIWWIKDLSGPDSLLQFEPVTIPLLSMILGPVDRLNVLPILLSISMYLQQKLMPKAPAAQQKTAQSEQMAQMQKMMGFMMLIMGLIFYNMPSGLNLYIMASSTFGILEQRRIRKHIGTQLERAEAAKQAEPGPKRGQRVQQLFKSLDKKTRATRTVRKTKH